VWEQHFVALPIYVVKDNFDVVKENFDVVKERSNE